MITEDLKMTQLVLKMIRFQSLYKSRVLALSENPPKRSQAPFSLMLLTLNERLYQLTCL